MKVTIWKKVCVSKYERNIYMIKVIHWRIQGGARDAPPWGSKFFHFHVVFGKKIEK